MMEEAGEEKGHERDTHHKILALQCATQPALHVNQSPM